MNSKAATRQPEEGDDEERLNQGKKGCEKGREGAVPSGTSMLEARATQNETAAFEEK
jgi:hypothetical protein